MPQLSNLKKISDEPPLHDSAPRGLEVHCVGTFAGRGALEIAAQNLGGTAALLIEKDPVARAMLSRKSPNAMITEVSTTETGATGGGLSRYQAYFHVAGPPWVRTGPSRETELRA